MLQEQRKCFCTHDNPAVTEPHRFTTKCLYGNHFSKVEESGIGILTLPAGAFMVGRFHLHDTEFKKAWDAMSILMMDNGIGPREGYYFEVFYTDSLFSPGEIHIVDICIPVD